MDKDKVDKDKDKVDKDKDKVDRDNVDKDKDGQGQGGVSSSISRTFLAQFGLVSCGSQRRKIPHFLGHCTPA